MQASHFTSIFLTSVLVAAAALAQGEAPKDEQPMTINGVETVCTGASTNVRADPQWQSFPFHLEVTGKDGQYLGDEKVTVSGNGQSVSVQCSGPWVLMKLPAGAYKVSLDVPDAGHKDVTVRVPGHTVVQFPGAGGAEGTNGRAVE
jgi:hypothetical protein